MKDFWQVLIVLILLSAGCGNDLSQLAQVEAEFSDLKLEVHINKGVVLLSETDLSIVTPNLIIENGDYKEPDNIFDHIMFYFSEPDIISINHLGEVIPAKEGKTSIRAVYNDKESKREIKSNEVDFEVIDDTAFKVISTTPENYNIDVHITDYAKTIQIEFNHKIVSTNPMGLVNLRNNPADDSTLAIESVSIYENVLTILLNGATLLEGFSYDIVLDKSIANSSGVGLTEDYWYRFASEKYFDNLDGTVYDPGQGVTWMKCSQGPPGQDYLVWNSDNNSCSNTGVSPSDIFEYCSAGDNSCDDGLILNGEGDSSLYDTCESLNSLNEGAGFAGKNNWHVPILSGLQSLARSGTPAINQNIFPGTCSSDYWSSNIRVSDGNNAWAVDFEYGSVNERYVENYDNDDFYYYVRCVSGS